MTGARLDTAELDAGYWYRNLRETVRLEPVVSSLLAQDQGHFLEVSPHPVLGLGLRESIDAAGDASAAALFTLRRGEGGRYFEPLGIARRLIRIDCDEQRPGLCARADAREGGCVRLCAGGSRAGGCLFGATLLNGGVKHTRRSRVALKPMNPRGIFDNLDDLEAGLADRFEVHEIRIQGAVALFAAWVGG